MSSRLPVFAEATERLSSLADDGDDGLPV